MPCAAVELEDPAGDVVEEVAVVGDGEHRPGVLGEEPLEPGDGLGVEVVGRLVEQQQVGRREQEPAQRDPAALAARERRDLGVARRAAQGVHGGVERAVEVPGVGAVDPVLHLALLLEERRHLVVGHRLGEARRDLLEPLQQVALLGDAVLDVPAHVLGRIELGLLGQEADGCARREPRLAEEVSSRPAMMRRSVDLPAPFGPRTPILAPGRNESEMSRSTCRSGPWNFCTRCIE